MKEAKRSYYRNWYQHWQQEKEEEEKQIAMKYFSDMEDEPYSVDLEVYKSKHEPTHQQFKERLYPMDRNAELKKVTREKPQYRTSRERAMNPGTDVIRGVLVGLPIVLVVVTLMYAMGIIPQDMVDRLFNGTGNSVVVTYMVQHDEVMQMSNEINQLLETHITANNISSQFQEELKAKHQLIQEEISLLTKLEGADFTSMNRLWSLKLTSLDQMVEYVSTNNEVTEEVLSYFVQFVTDQNEIGEEFSLAMSNLLTSQNIEYRQLINGDIELVTSN